MAIRRVLSEYKINNDGYDIDLNIDMESLTMSLSCEDPKLNISIGFEEIEKTRVIFNNLLSALDFADVEFKSQINNPK